ncbi:MAG: DUF4291 domain-containing protein [Zavarzinella sp.]
MKQLFVENYLEQLCHWPKEGKHILAHFDADTIIVYQAYHQEIAEYAVEHRAFGGFGGASFSYSRMSWIKPNFLWMMFRSGWATKPNQERILALRISRHFFDSLLAQSVASTFDQEKYVTIDEWQQALQKSNVRMQWDPDHNPSGNPISRRAIQLGLRREMLTRFGKRELKEVIDITSFVTEQREVLQGNKNMLLTVSERVYQPSDEAIRKQIGLDDWPANV